MLDTAEVPKRRIWAYKGETVTCIKGHAICSIAEDILVGSPRHAGRFTNWVQPEPDRKTSVADIRCTKCRGVWVRGNTKHGWQFHFGAPPHGEWR